ncbi:TIGR03618 family F420-dependent PPOX class oxidoreductase [Nonomuraea glycinis]|jgi:PPOX class probable F420-dependent enzyme|uniref:TIGR03618 family F420-dependent PPOX class oxidoreductase n=1 Tax=Nonomuraea glycinis TaxID=2047744 RepID=UPI002E15A099|nr:TIGR03618 family F420-dependent PPOX class oxidoreductase [Nonomuraea glycinis]
MGNGPLPIASGELMSYLLSCKSLQLATLNPDGSPHLATMWFGVLDDDIVMWTQRTSVKARNMGHDPRIACLVESGDAYASLKGVSITGRAEFVQDEEGLLRIGEAIISRNYSDADRPDYRQMALSGARVGIVVRAAHWASWDFARTAAATR